MTEGTQKVRPEVRIELDKSRTLLLDLNGMVAFEEVTGKNLFDKEVAESLSKEIHPKDLRALLWACLMHEDEELTEKQVGHLISIGNIMEVTQKVTEAYSAAMPESKGEPPPLAKRRRTG